MVDRKDKQRSQFNPRDGRRLSNAKYWKLKDIWQVENIGGPFTQRGCHPKACMWIGMEYGRTASLTGKHCVNCMRKPKNSIRNLYFG